MQYKSYHYKQAEILKNSCTFLDASSHLYKRVCPSACPYVRPSVCPYVRYQFRNTANGRILLPARACFFLTRHGMHHAVVSCGARARDMAVNIWWNFLSSFHFPPLKTFVSCAGGSFGSLSCYFGTIFCF